MIRWDLLSLNPEEQWAKLVSEERNPELAGGALKWALANMTPDELRMLRDALNDPKMFKFLCEGGAAERGGR